MGIMVYSICLIMGNAGFTSSTVGFRVQVFTGRIWDFPKIRVPYFGVLFIKGSYDLGYYIKVGSPTFGNPPRWAFGSTEASRLCKRRRPSPSSAS